MIKELSTGILDKAARCFKDVRKSLVEGAAFLHKISNERLYEGTYSSFGEFCEEGCQISQSFAAKLIKVHEHYILKGNVPRSQIGNIDNEKLYLAIALKGTPEEQALRAQTWSRSEIKAEIASKGGAECIHEHTVTICSKCHARV